MLHLFVYNIAMVIHRTSYFIVNDSIKTINKIIIRTKQIFFTKINRFDDKQLYEKR